MPEFDYDRAIEIAEGVYWIGYYDEKASFHCNPYLIIYVLRKMQRTVRRPLSCLRIHQSPR